MCAISLFCFMLQFILFLYFFIFCGFYYSLLCCLFCTVWCTMFSSWLKFWCTNYFGMLWIRLANFLNHDFMKCYDEFFIILWSLMTGTLGSSRHLYRILYVVHFKIDINCVGYTFPELITFFYSVPKLSLLTASEVLYS